MDELSPEHIARVLKPLQRATAEAFVQNVMRAVRTLEPLRETLPWRVFVRWAFPALGFAIGSFAVALLYTVPPTPSVTESLLWGEPEAAVVSATAPANATEDPLLDAAEAKP